MSILATMPPKASSASSPCWTASPLLADLRRLHASTYARLRPFHLRSVAVKPRPLQPTSSASSRLDAIRSRATATLVCQHRSCRRRCPLAHYARPLASSVVGAFAIRLCSGCCCLVTHERVGSGPIASLFHGPIAAHRSVTCVRPTPGISCEAVPASMPPAGAGMRRHVHPGNHAAESFVSFIPLFCGFALHAAPSASRSAHPQAVSTRSRSWSMDRPLPSTTFGLGCGRSGGTS
jgi:hypothetical protein